MCLKKSSEKTTYIFVEKIQRHVSKFVIKVYLHSAIPFKNFCSFREYYTYITTEFKIKRFLEITSISQVKERNSSSTFSKKLLLKTRETKYRKGVITYHGDNSKS